MNFDGESPPSRDEPAGMRDEVESFYVKTLPDAITWAASLAYGGGMGACDAEEFVHSAYALAITRWADVRQHPSPVGWLHLAIFNQYRNERRRRRRRREEPIDEDLAARCCVEELESMVILNEDLIELLQGIRQLSPTQRDVLLLKLVEFTDSEIAETLGISRSSVSTHAHRARERLKRSLLRGREVNPDGGSR